MSYVGGVQQGPTPVVASCDACRLIDRDDSPKLVQYCKICNAWLCDSCRASPWRRAKAAVRRLIGD